MNETSFSGPAGRFPRKGREIFKVVVLVCQFFEIFMIVQIVAGAAAVIKFNLPVLEMVMPVMGYRFEGSQPHATRHADYLAVRIGAQEKISVRT